MWRPPSFENLEKLVKSLETAVEHQIEEDREKLLKLKSLLETMAKEKQLVVPDETPKYNDCDC